LILLAKKLIVLRFRKTMKENSTRNPAGMRATHFPARVLEDVLTRELHLPRLQQQRAWGTIYVVAYTVLVHPEVTTSAVVLHRSEAVCIYYVEDFNGNPQLLLAERME
jgi:hypothetical protein